MFAFNEAFKPGSYEQSHFFISTRVLWWGRSKHNTRNNVLNCSNMTVYEIRRETINNGIQFKSLWHADPMLICKFAILLPQQCSPYLCVRVYLCVSVLQVHVRKDMSGIFLYARSVFVMWCKTIFHMIIFILRYCLQCLYWCLNHCRIETIR